MRRRGSRSGWRGLGAGALAGILLACAADTAAPAPEHVEPGEPPSEDPRIACMREHAAEPGSTAPGPTGRSVEHAARVAVVRALCAELHDHGGVSASVAIVRDGAVVLSLAIGPRCRGEAEPLRASTPLRIGSITKLVTAALALAVAERQGLSLDQPLPQLPELDPAPSLRSLLTHTAGLRDPEPHELLSRGDRWPEALQEHREAAGRHVYANAGFLLVGRWLERSSGSTFRELYAAEPTLAPVRARVSLTGAAAAPGCGHRRGLGWQAVRPSAEPPLPEWTLPAGGGLASAEDLARLPFALERSGWLPAMIGTRVRSDRPGWDYGLGIRIRGAEGPSEAQGSAEPKPATDDDLVLAHSGRTDTHWAELQWSPRHRVAVAVLSSTPQPYKATLHAAFTAALASAEADDPAP